MRRVLLSIFVAAGCARGSYVGSARSEAPGAPASEDPDISIERTPREEPPQEIDPDARKIVIGEDEGPSEPVVSQPERPSMPSMMPSVVTGPAGAAPIAVPDED